MIIYDADEARHLVMPKAWKAHDELEAWTGADYLVSPLTLPYHSQTLLGKHLKAGGFLVQRKTGLDMVNSMADSGNLWDLLERMLRFCRQYHPGARPAQRVVLGLGMFYAQQDGSLRVNSKTAKRANFWQLQGAIERVFERDCTYVAVSAGPEGLYKWLRMKELHAQDNQAHPTKHTVLGPTTMYDQVETVDAYDKPLQELVVVRDARRTLATFPGMGAQKVNAVWEFAQYNLARALTLVTDPLLVKTPNRPVGVGLGLVQAWREWLGLEPDEFLLINRLEQSPPVTSERTNGKHS